MTVYRFTTFDAPLGVNGTIASGINDAGQIVGSYYDSAGVSHGYILSGTYNTRLIVHGLAVTGGTYMTLDDPLATRGTSATGINNSGQIVGSYVDNSASHAFLYSTAGASPANVPFIGGTFITLAGQSSIVPHIASGINDSGQIVGVTRGETPFFGIQNVGYLETAGSSITIGRGAYYTSANGINESGQIVGNELGSVVSSYSIQPESGYFYESGVHTQLKYPSAANTNAYGINDTGTIVGNYVGLSYRDTGGLPPSRSDVLGLKHGFIYDHTSGSWITLDAPLATTVPDAAASGGTIARDINNVGQIVGSYIDADGKLHGFVATPQPASATSDFNGDATSDILFINSVTHNADSWKISNGKWAGSVDFGSHPGSGWQVGGIGDFNEDGTQDVLWFDQASGQTDTWLLKNGQWSASVSFGNHPGTSIVAGVGDFNDDGVSDVLWFDLTTGKVDEWKIGANGKWAGSIDIGAHPGSGWTVGAIGDFNGDITSDILWVNNATGETDIWKLVNGYWSASVSPGTHANSSVVVGSGDFNGDGTSDILWFNQSTGTLDLWKIRDGKWSGSSDLGAHPGAGWHVTGTGDYNGDGSSDVLWSNTTTGDNDIWLIKNGQWSESVPPGAHAANDWVIPHQT